MANYKLLKRLERSIYLIKNLPGISKGEILERLRNDYDQEISDRTLERDFEILKTDFGLEIQYDRSKRGYVLDDDPERIATFFKFAELSSLAEIYETGLKDYKTFQKWVIPDDSSGFYGLQNMKPILKGITLAQKIRFTKMNFFHDDSKEYIVSPFRLKEFLNRWYLIAVPDGMEEIRTFGLDRIRNVHILKKKGSKFKNIEIQLNQFREVVGLTYSLEPLQKIVLKVTNEQIKYLRSLPLHHSQVCIDDHYKDGWGRVNYELKPNYEFMAEILKLGASAVILEPLALREKITEQITIMHKLYE
ncbi:helix-turn-helix transcriptional regulator [Maribacter luteus]|uniref:WYL domain-containing protein n=1 Tax=Maribacter luteus TaxID=2594478 RepID=A0A6I2MID1_9FLAO|nr:WYL domain-containing protein [Maribacter luteus]MRX62587.1 WYL domain-containing protein [Maribacter luteus]